MLLITCFLPLVLHQVSDTAKTLTAKGILTPIQVSQMKGSNKPVTRAELLEVLVKLVDHLEASTKQSKSKSTASTVKDPRLAGRHIVKLGYLPSDADILSDSKKTVSQVELAQTLASIVTRWSEKRVPITPASRRSNPIPHKNENNGG